GAPAPFVEGAADRVALDATLAQVGAHVRAVAVEDADLPILSGKGHQAGAKDIQAVGLAVAVLAGQPQAVPATGESRLQLFGFDAVQGTHLVVLPSRFSRAASDSGRPLQRVHLPGSALPAFPGHLLLVA